jgi:hypothetical protein
MYYFIVDGCFSCEKSIRKRVHIYIYINVCVEERHDRKYTDDESGVENTETWYSYRAVWSTEAIDSHRFDDWSYVNPTHWPYNSKQVSIFFIDLCIDLYIYKYKYVYISASSLGLTLLSRDNLFQTLLLTIMKVKS